SGQFKTINTTEVKEGEIKSRNRLTGEIDFDWLDDDTEREQLNTAGYVAYFELLNGYRQTLYMSSAEIKAHATRYSQSFKYGTGIWKDNFDAMAKKTVLKLILSKYAPLSIDMQKAIEVDQSDGNKNYPDIPKEGLEVEVIEAEETKNKA
ncbi:recombinase RecT, partial [Candidatus Saccharibacteria bacterium]|nr:recombinase RecT [Candidatus Saccharibacteria bacterium]